MVVVEMLVKCMRKYIDKKDLDILSQFRKSPNDCARAKVEELPIAIV